ncbi:hypothetical protein ONE63_004731 [Megalurothrips usitatus]|uniref:Uncharacterized protein n=1 Tax=Megalurothrips usitatus TaxID=439358 RepID=A0AAV7X3X6_9NEOP|nr:hypothetical protein ONE63_004731 [Megalurothrips usitatus]
MTRGAWGPRTPRSRFPEYCSYFRRGCADGYVLRLRVLALGQHLGGDVLGGPQVDDAVGGGGGGGRAAAAGLPPLHGPAVLLEGGRERVREGAGLRAGLADEGVAAERRAGGVGPRHEHAAKDARVHQVLHAVRDAVDGQQVAVDAHPGGRHLERGARQTLARRQRPRRGHHGVDGGAGVLDAPEAAGLPPPEALDGEGLRQAGLLLLLLRRRRRRPGRRRHHGVLVVVDVVVVVGDDRRRRDPRRRAARELLHEGVLGLAVQRVTAGAAEASGSAARRPEGADAGLGLVAGLGGALGPDQAAAPAGGALRRRARALGRTAGAGGGAGAGAGAGRARRRGRRQHQARRAADGPPGTGAAR